MNEEKIKLLRDIGLTRLQANIYVVLLQESGMTGYKIARKINEPVSNTYEALDSLQKKGAIISNEISGKRKYTALPVGDYLDQLEKNFKTKRQHIEKELKNLKTTSVQEGIYRIDSIDQIYYRAGQMIKNAGEIIVADICPTPLQKLLKLFRSASKRKTIVQIKSYTDISIPGCDIINSGEMESPMDYWPIEWMSLIIPGKEYLTALFEKDGGENVFEAIWCKNSLLSSFSYDGFKNELMFTIVLNMLLKNCSNEEILSRLEKYRNLRLKDIKLVNGIIDSFRNK